MAIRGIRYQQQGKTNNAGSNAAREEADTPSTEENNGVANEELPFNTPSAIQDDLQDVSEGQEDSN